MFSNNHPDIQYLPIFTLGNSTLYFYLKHPDDLFYQLASINSLSTDTLKELALKINNKYIGYIQEYIVHFNNEIGNIIFTKEIYKKFQNTIVNQTPIIFDVINSSDQNKRQSAIQLLTRLNTTSSVKNTEPPKKFLWIGDKPPHRNKFELKEIIISDVKVKAFVCDDPDINANNIARTYNTPAFKAIAKNIFYTKKNTVILDFSEYDELTKNDSDAAKAYYIKYFSNICELSAAQNKRKYHSDDTSTSNSNNNNLNTHTPASNKDDILTQANQIFQQINHPKKTRKINLSNHHATQFNVQHANETSQYKTAPIVVTGEVISNTQLPEMIKAQVTGNQKPKT